MIALKTFGNGKRRPINLFFTEIIIALLFFSISGAVILQVFAKADMKSRQSAELEKVILFAQTFAEAYSQSGDFGKAAELVPGASISEISGEYDDPSHMELILEGGRVHMKAAEEHTSTDAGVLSELNMVFISDEKEVYSMSCAAYIPSGGDSDG